MSENTLYSQYQNGISAKPAPAEKSDKRGKKAERKQAKNWKPFWKEATCQLHQLLLILTTLPPNQRPRLNLRTLLACLVTRKFSARRKLGRLFLTPSMNSWTTWTSRERAKKDVTWNCSGPKLSCLTPDLSQASLRSVQKTSGLFDTEKAGNKTVAGKASNSGLDLLAAAMDPEPLSLSALVPSDAALGGIFQDVPLELADADFMDSYMDLSNFLMPEDLKDPEPVDTGLVEPEAFDEKVSITDFSGLQALLNPEPADVVITITAPAPSSTPSSRKRKAAETFDHDVVVDETPAGVYDHDYVSTKKLKKASIVEEDVKPTPSTSRSTTAPGKSGSKYRERRDKNNVASRRSRQIRKMKYVEMDQEADRLTTDNERLRNKIEELESLAKIMKAELIKKMTEK